MNIHEFQRMMRQIYFHRDSKRGIEGTFDWLVDEVKELGEALENNDKKVLENEFADVIAWLASLANVANVNLE
ncbi:nucleotide pyrophosphohydrolase, partial [Candidatus Bathyarchaeota archaeon]